MTSSPKSRFTDFRDPMIYHEFQRFVENRGKTFAKLNRIEESDEFQLFISLHLLRRWFLPYMDIAEAKRTIVDGSDDNQTDSIALIVNDQLVYDSDTLDAALDDIEELSFRLVLIQVTRSNNFAQNKMSCFVDGVDHFLADSATLEENSAIRKLRDLKDRILAAARNVEKPSVEIFLYYCSLGKWTDDNRQRKWSEWNYQKIKDRSPDIAEVELETVDYLRICELINQNQQAHRLPQSSEPYEKTIAAPNLVSFNRIPSAEAWIGYVDGDEYIKLLERDDEQGMEERIFSENVRGFNGMTNSVNKSIDETLRTPSNSNFVLLNNGVTIITPEAEFEGGKLTLRNYQIVNGLQTSYMLYRNRRRLSGTDVAIPLKVVRTNDVNLMHSIVIGTNSQTSIDKVQFVSQNVFVRDLVTHFEQIGDQDPTRRIRLERRDGELASAQSVEDQTRVIDLEDLIKGSVSFILGRPHTARRGIASILPMVQDKSLFHEAHLLEPYFCSAYAIHLVRSFFRNSSRWKDLQKPYEDHLVHLLRVTCEPIPMPPNALTSEEGKAYWQALEKEMGKDRKVKRSLNRACDALAKIRAATPRGPKRRNLPKMASTTAKSTEMLRG